MKQKFHLIVAISILLVGCTNPYTKFYLDRTRGVDTTAIVPTDKPLLFRGNDPDVDYFRMLEDGFNLIGYSNFNGADNVNVSSALKQATKINASVVLVYSKYTNTVSGLVPLTLPDTQTSTTTLYGNVMGPGGFATYSGSASSTTYGTRTMYMPFSVNRYDYFASYWVKLGHPSSVFPCGNCQRNSSR